MSSDVSVTFSSDADKLKSSIEALTKSVTVFGDSLDATSKDSAKLSSGLGNTERAASSAVKAFEHAQKEVVRIAKDTAIAHELTWDSLTQGVHSSIEIVKSSISDAKSAFDYLREGAALGESEQNFKAYATSIGKSSNSMMLALRKATKSQVSDLELMRLSVNTMKAGVTTDTNALAKLFEVADAKSNIFGMSIAEAFEKISTAISNGERDTLIQFDLLPKKLLDSKESANLLKDTTQLLYEVIRHGSNDIKISSEVGKTAADTFNQLEASVRNLNDAFKKDLSVSLIPLVEFVKDDGLPLVKSCLGFLNDTVVTVKELESQFGLLTTATLTVSGAMGGLALLKVGKWFAGITTAALTATKAIGGLSAVVAAIALPAAVKVAAVGALAAPVGYLGYLKYGEMKAEQITAARLQDLLASKNPADVAEGKKMLLEMKLSDSTSEGLSGRSLEAFGTKAESFNKESIKKLISLSNESISKYEAPKEKNSLVDYRRFIAQEKKQLALLKEILEVQEGIVILEEKRKEILKEQDEFMEKKRTAALLKAEQAAAKQEKKLAEWSNNFNFSKFSGAPYSGKSKAPLPTDMTPDYYYSLEEAMSAAYDSNRNLEISVESLLAGLESVGIASLSMLDGFKLGNNEFIAETLKTATKYAAEAVNSFDMLKDSYESLFDSSTVSNAKSAVGYLQDFLELTIKPVKEERLLPEGLDSYGGNVMNALWRGSNSSKEDDAKKAYSAIEINLIEDLSSAVQNGIINSDIVSTIQSFGSSLGGALSRTYTASNPIISPDNKFNFGNLVGGFAISTATSWLAKSLGERGDRGKEEAKAAITNLEQGLMHAYLNTFEAQLNPYVKMREIKLLEESRQYDPNIGTGIEKVPQAWFWGGILGHDDHWPIDNGVQDATDRMNETLRHVEQSAANEKRTLEAWTAKGRDFDVIERQVRNYKDIIALAESFAMISRPGVGTEHRSYHEEIHEREIELINLERRLGTMTAERTSSANSAFLAYSPWVDWVDSKYDDRIGIANRFGGVSKYSDKFSELSASEEYGIYQKLSEGLADRKISGDMLESVKMAGLNQYNLSALQYTDPTAYTEQYADYVERQIEAYEEVMKRSEDIFKDASKTYDERAQALQEYEAASAGYYNSRIENLKEEQAQQEAVKRKELEAQARSRTHLESALSLYGELSQRGDKIAIIQGGDVAGALKNAIQKYTDDPEMIAVLQGALKLTEDKARWG